MSLPAYPEYKDSGIPWLGKIPSHWSVHSLKRIANLKSGESITAEQIREEGVYPVYGGNGLRGYTSLFTHEGRFPLIGRQGALCGNVNYSDGKFWASEHAVVATPLKAGTSVIWLGELLRAMNLNQYSVSAAQPGLSVEAISNLRVPYPPSVEQFAIADFVNRETSKLDALIAEQEKLLELLAEKRQATISHAVTRGLNPNVPMMDSSVEWLGAIPKHWNVIRLAQLFREISEAGEDALPILSVSIHHGVSDGELDEDEMERKVTRSDDRSKYKRVAPGDLVYNMMRAWQGGFGSVEVLGMVSPAYVVARPIGDNFVTGYIEQLLRTAAGAQEAKRYSKGVTDFRLRLYWDEFKNICVPLPPKDEQVAIMHALDDSNARIDGLATEAKTVISLLGERRAALISAAVTGKIDVREHSSALAAAA